MTETDNLMFGKFQENELPKSKNQKLNWTDYTGLHTTLKET